MQVGTLSSPQPLRIQQHGLSLVLIIFCRAFVNTALSSSGTFLSSPVHAALPFLISAALPSSLTQPFYPSFVVMRFSFLLTQRIITKEDAFPLSSFDIVLLSFVDTIIRSFPVTVCPSFVNTAFHSFCLQHLFFVHP